MADSNALSRRRFFTATAAAAAGAAAIGMAAASPASAASAAKPAGTAGVTTLPDGRLQVDTAQIPALKWVGGAVVVGRLRGVQVGLVRTKASKYRAVALTCPCGAGALAWDGNGWECRAHGCSFSAKGKVRRGPAVAKLTKFPVVNVGKHVTIG
jgi:Rieske Fe-S protein